MAQHPGWNKQAALATLLFALGGAAYWLEFSHKPKKEDSDAQVKKPLFIKGLAVQDVRIAAAPSKVFSLHCLETCRVGENSKWQLTEPLKLKADETNATALLSSINNMSANETIDLSEETPEKRATLLKEYGLDAEARKVTGRTLEVKTDKGSKALHIGLQHPIGDGTFALLETDGKLDESKVLVLPGYFKSTFEHDLTYWRDKKLFSLGAHEVDAFRLEGGKAGTLEAKKNEGLWTLRSASQEFAGDIENIDNFLSAATYLAAKEFADKGVIQGASPVFSMTLQKEKTAVTLKLFSANKKLFATVSGSDPVYELELSARDRIDKKLDEIRQSRLITSVERFTAKKLAFQGEGLTASGLVLSNTDGKWVNAAKEEMDNAKIQSFLDKLSAARIQEFGKGPAPDKGAITFTLSDDKSETKRKILFWKSGDKLYARDLNSKRSEIVRIDSTLAPELPWSGVDAYKKAAPGAKPSQAPHP